MSLEKNTLKSVAVESAPRLRVNESVRVSIQSTQEVFPESVLLQQVSGLDDESLAILDYELNKTNEIWGVFGSFDENTTGVEVLLAELKETPGDTEKKVIAKHIIELVVANAG